ncbi:MAG: MBOAT family protein [Flavobacteriales bacterium]|nr:MBOAT family protein [Flavobacteriales bacterium]
MLFNSTEFLVFFPVVVGLFFALPYKWRWLLLLVASCVFYMAFVPVYILILGFTIGVDYFAGILIERSLGADRKRWLVLSIFANVGVLAIFKYYAFLTGNLEVFLASVGMARHFPDLGILLPIGLSFHTFQSLSYTVEVYRGHVPAERRFGIFALYVMFFPQLVAGPIDRPQSLLPQFHARRPFNMDDLRSGLVKMAYGFFKKVVVADRLALFVDPVYADLGSRNSFTILVATVFFAIQIYCDFSGYSDIAIGAARIMGFRLMENFRRPYLSGSVSEFWGRWHISLSSWFRDYLYIPLGGNRVLKWRWYYNLIITFLISGLWHGANWTYVIWGALQGGYLVASIMLGRSSSRMVQAIGLHRVPRVRRAINVSFTFVLVTLAWVFFRATTAKQAFTGLGKLLHFHGPIAFDGVFDNVDNYHFAACMGAIALLVLSYRLPIDLRLKRPRTFIVLTTLIIIVLGRNGGDFIYFQF